MQTPLRTVNALSSTQYVMNPRSIPGNGLPMYQYSKTDASFLDSRTPFVNTDHVGIGPQYVPRYDLQKMLDSNRNKLRMSDRQLDNASRSQQAYGYRVNPNTIVMPSISSREQTPRDYRPIELRLLPGQRQQIASRQAVTTINIGRVGK